MSNSIKIGIIGDYDSQRLSHKATNEALNHCADYLGINPEYQKLLDESGFKIVGTDETSEARILELTKNKFFVATLFQPQLSSSPTNPNKLILEYLTCAKEFHL